MEGHTSDNIVFSGRPMSDEQGYVTPEQFEQLFLGCKDDRERLLVRLLWKSGRRVGELLTLKMKDVDFNLANITWQIEKKNTIRKREGERKEAFEKRQRDKKPYFAIKPIDLRTLKMLADYGTNEQIHLEQHIFYSQFKGKEFPMTRFRIFQIIRAIGKRVGIEYIGNKRLHPHHFRHGFAVKIAKDAKSPQDIFLLKDALEHSRLDVTMNYLHHSQKELRELIEKD